MLQNYNIYKNAIMKKIWKYKLPRFAFNPFFGKISQTEISLPINLYFQHIFFISETSEKIHNSTL